MNKDIDNMNERELLAELVRQGRRTERAEKIKICVLAALLLTVLVLALICIPKVLAPIRSISRSMGEIEQSFDEMKQVLSRFDEDTIDQFKETMESLGETSQQARAFMDKLKDSGLDKLQETIEGLNKSLGSLGSFMNFFGG